MLAIILKMKNILFLSKTTILFKLRVFLIKLFILIIKLTIKGVHRLKKITYISLLVLVFLNGCGTDEVLLIGKRTDTDRVEYNQEIRDKNVITQVKNILENKTENQISENPIVYPDFILLIKNEKENISTYNYAIWMNNSKNAILSDGTFEYENNYELSEENTQELKELLHN